jgi:hypothetical protein
VISRGDVRNWLLFGVFAYDTQNKCKFFQDETYSRGKSMKSYSMGSVIIPHFLPCYQQVLI